jgi:outer membrane protein TolC
MTRSHAARCALRRTFFALVSIASPALLQAQAGRDLTVDETVRLGLENNPRLRAAAADINAARAGYRQARAALLPALRAQGSFTRLMSNVPDVEFRLPGFDSAFTFQGIERNRYYAELSVEQPLVTALRLRQEARAAAHELEAASADAGQERADLAFEIRRTYWNLRRANAQRAALNTSLAQVDEHLKDVRNRLEAGTALRKDLLAAQTRRSEVQLEILEADNAVRVGQLELNRLIGLPLDTRVRPIATVAVDSAIAPLETLTAQALSERPQLVALGEQVNALRAEVRAAESTRLPELDFISRYVYARPNPYFFSVQTRFRSSWELGFSARWDIWQGNRKSAVTSEARARVQAAEARLADVRTEVAVDVARQQLEVVRATEAITVAAQAVTEGEESFRVARQQFTEGVALSSDVLDAEQALRRAQARRAQSEADYAIARAALLAAQGRVW